MKRTPSMKISVIISYDVTVEYRLFLSLTSLYAISYFIRKERKEKNIYKLQQLSFDSMCVLKFLRLICLLSQHVFRFYSQ